MDKLIHIQYSRKSSEEEERQALSIEAQERELTDFADRVKFEVIKPRLVETKSAHKPGRGIFNEMLDKIERGEANAILCWKLDRLARNALDGGRIVWLMDEGKLKQIDTPYKSFKNTADDKFLMSIEFGMSKKYSDDLSDNVKRGIRQKYERGEYPTYAPIGYINARANGAKNIYPDPERKDPLIRLFIEYATGKYSLGQMVKMIFSWGLRTRKGKPISKSHLHRIIQDSVYYGVYRHGGELHNGSYEPLITKSLFDKVQEVLKDRSKPKKINNDWAYAGLLKCGCGCGASIIFETKKKHYERTDRW